MPIKTSGFPKAAADLVDTAQSLPERLNNGVNKILQGPKTPQAFSFKKGAFRLQSNRSKKYLEFQFNPESMKESRDVKYATVQPIQSELPIYQHVSFGERTLSFELFFNGLEHKSGRATSVAKTAPFDNKLGILSRPLDKVINGAVALGASRIPFAEGVGTASGILFNKIFTSDPAPQPTETNRRVPDDLEALRNLMYGTGNKPPPIILFDWFGYEGSAWILTDLKEEVTMWNKDQVPLHVKVDITLKEVDNDKFKSRFSNRVFLR